MGGLTQKKMVRWIVFIIILQAAWWLIPLGIIITVLLHYNII